MRKWSEQFVRQLADKEYRRAYVSSYACDVLAWQVGLMVDTRKAGGLQDPVKVEKLLRPLLKLANHIDCGLVVRFVDWEEWIDQLELPVGSLTKLRFDLDRLLTHSSRPVD